MGGRGSDRGQLLSTLDPKGNTHDTEGKYGLLGLKGSNIMEGICRLPAGRVSGHLLVGRWVSGLENFEASLLTFRRKEREAE